MRRRHDSVAHVCPDDADGGHLLQPAQLAPSSAIGSATPSGMQHADADPSANRVAGRVRLENPVNAGTPRPKGACRVLLIGDVISKPGQIAVEALLPGPARTVGSTS